MNKASSLYNVLDENGNTITGDIIEKDAKSKISELVLNHSKPCILKANSRKSVVLYTKLPNADKVALTTFMSLENCLNALRKRGLE